MPKPSKKAEYESAPKTMSAEENIEPDVTHGPGVTGTPISIEPIREDTTAPEPPDPEEPDDPGTPPQLRDDHSRFVFRVKQGDKFQVTVTINKKVLEDLSVVVPPNIHLKRGNAAIQLSFRDCTGGYLTKDDGVTPAMLPVLVRYIENAQKPKKLVSRLIVADASLGDVVIVAQRAIVTDDTATPPIYAVVGEKRRCRVGSLKIVP